MHYIENESDNCLLVKFYQCIQEDELQKLCNLLVMEKQLNTNHNCIGKHIKVFFFRIMKHKLRKNFEQYWHKMVATYISMSGKEGGNKV